jgi:hypothetical protein
MEKVCEQLFFKSGEFLDRAEQSQECCPLNDAGDDFFLVQILFKKIVKFSQHHASCWKDYWYHNHFFHLPL